MAKKRLSITVRGRHKEWAFTFYGDPAHLAEWRADGLEIHETENTIPDCVARLGLVRPWCFLQDIFNLKNPFH